MREPGTRRGGERTTPHGETPYSPTSLLRALTADPYSVDTLREDEHPAAEATPPDTLPMRMLTLVLALLLGVVVAVAVADLRADARGTDSPRALLEQEVRDSRAEADDLETQRATLEEQILQAQGEVLDEAGKGGAERLADFERAGAGTALTGPGVVLVLDDSAPLPASPGDTTGAVNRVTDGDLQIAVNGLWAAGAEAIDINGQRVSGTTAIRTAGSAVLVDFRPLSPPYRVTALGDPEQLRAGVQEGEAGEYLTEISTRYGIRTSWETGQEYTVPARSVGTLREAQIADGTDPDTLQDTPPTGSPSGSSTAAPSGTEEDSP